MQNTHSSTHIENGYWNFNEGDKFGGLVLIQKYKQIFPHHIVLIGF